MFQIASASSGVAGLIIRRLLYRDSAERRSALLLRPGASRKNVVLQADGARLLIDPVGLQFEPGAIGRRRQQRDPAAEQDRDHREADLVDQAGGEQASEQLPATE